MRVLKRFFKFPFTVAGYDIRRKSHIGLDLINDIKAIYGDNAPRVIFDVGAHQGQTAQMLARAFPEAQIHSFEPAPETFEILQREVSALKTVRSVHSALGRIEGTGSLNINRSTATNSMLRRGQVDDNAVAELIQPVSTSTVRVQTVDGYCESGGIGVVDLLKMDVQGFEIEVLGGAHTLLAQSRVCLIYCEVAFQGIYEGQPLFEDVYREVTKHGFRLVDLYGHVRARFHAINWCDALFVEPKALSKRLAEFC